MNLISLKLLLVQVQFRIFSHLDPTFEENTNPEAKVEKSGSG